MTIAVLTRCVVEFVSPIAIYQILHHVESDGEGAIVKPWYSNSTHIQYHQYGINNT